MTTLILSFLLLLTVMVSALVGFIRGLNKSVIRIMTFALAIIMTFVIAGPVSTAIAGAIVVENQTLGEILLEKACSVEMIANIIEAAPLMKEAILAAPAFVIAIAVFPVVFLLFQFITWIAYLFAQKPLRKLIFKDDGQPKEESGKVRLGKKFAGLGIGAVAGVLIFGMLMAPLFGIFSVLPQKSALDEVIDTLTEQGAIKDQATADMIKYELGAIDSFTVKMYSFIGLTPAGAAYLSSVSKIEHEGESTSLIKEFDALFAVVKRAVNGGLLKAVMDPDDKGELYRILSDTRFINAFINDMFRSKLLRNAIPEITAMAMESAARMLGVPETEKDAYDKMMGEMSQAVKLSGVDFEAIRLYDESYGITYTDSVSGNSSRDTLMTKEEYEEEIEKLRMLEREIAKIIERNVGNGNEAAAEGIAVQFILGIKEFAENYGNESIEYFTVANVLETISEIDFESIDIDVTEEGDKKEAENSANEMLAMLKGDTEFEALISTVEELKENIYNTVKEALKDDESSEATANTLAFVVSNLAFAVADASDENGKINLTDLNYEKFADAIEAFRNSATLKNVGSAVFDIITSSDIGKKEVLGDAMRIIKSEYESNSEIGEEIEFVGAAIEYLNAVNQSEGEPTKDVIESFAELVDKLNDTTLELIAHIITDNTMMGMGIPEKYAESAYEVFEMLLHELVKIKGASSYDDEAKAVLSLYVIAIHGIEEHDESDIKHLAEHAVISEAVYNMLTQVTVSDPFGVEVKSESNREILSATIEKCYAESGKTLREYNVYMAIAKLLGLENEVELDK